MPARRRRARFGIDRRPPRSERPIAKAASRPAGSSGGVTFRVRKRPLLPRPLVADGLGALAWGLEPAAGEAMLPPQFDIADRSAATKAVDQWLRDSVGDEFRLELTISAVWWCHRLPELAAALPSGSWWALLDRLTRMVVDAGPVGIGDAPSDGDPLIHQLLAGELALTLAYLFPEIAACRALLAEARWSLLGRAD